MWDILLLISYLGPLAKQAQRLCMSRDEQKERGFRIVIEQSEVSCQVQRETLQGESSRSDDHQHETRRIQEKQYTNGVCNKMFQNISYEFEEVM